PPRSCLRAQKDRGRWQGDYSYSYFRMGGNAPVRWSSMSSDSFQQALQRAAETCGVDPGYWDIWGRHHATTPEAQQVILGALGIDAADEERLRQSLAARQRREWERGLPPSIVARQG